jgi:hypothetical protein
MSYYIDLATKIRAAGQIEGADAIENLYRKRHELEKVVKRITDTCNQLMKEIEALKHGKRH